MKKKISNLINKKNECLRNGEDEKAEQIRMEIRLLKEEAKVSADEVKNNSKFKKVKNNSKKPIIIPDQVIINNIDITDKLYELLNSKYAEEAKVIYMSIIDFCKERQNYINSVLKKSINSYEVNETLELSEKSKRVIQSLQNCKSLNQSEIQIRISKIRDLLSSYEINLENITLKSTLYNEILCINETKKLAYRLLTGIKRQPVIPKQSTVFDQTVITQKQQEIVEGIYIGKIPKCGISDYYFAAKYYLETEKVSKTDIISLVKHLINNYSFNEKNLYYIENFQKAIKKAIKNFKTSDKKTINSMIGKLNNKRQQMIQNDPRFEIILYFIFNNYEEYVNKMLDEMPDIASCMYNGKSTVINVYKALLNEYNNILQMRYGYNEKTIDLLENVFVKLYNLNSDDKTEIELITDEYIKQIKQIGCSTVSKNIILFRISKIRNSVGISNDMKFPEIQGESYSYLDFYYKKELSNSERRCVNNSICFDENNTTTYSVSRNGEYLILKINVVDLTPYFLVGTDLYELATKDCIDSNNMRKYSKFSTDKANPSITFEFHFYKGILEANYIYNSIVKPMEKTNFDVKYAQDLETINIFDMRSGFDGLIKQSLEANKKNIPYIVSYIEGDLNYRIFNDLNYLFGKLKHSDFDLINKMLESSSRKFGISTDVVKKYPYEVNVINPVLKYSYILMQRIIKSYYNPGFSVSIDEINSFVVERGKVLKK